MLRLRQGLSSRVVGHRSVRVARVSGGVTLTPPSSHPCPPAPRRRTTAPARGRLLHTAATPSASEVQARGTERAPAASIPQHEAFEVVESAYLNEYDATAVLYCHKGTGTEMLSLICSETEKVFGIAFKTPVENDTGVPHILEHSVLCGSRKYPVKEPFKELMKSSLHTYLNAMTYPDRTVYPVASPNTKDFYHLVDVYLDAVFYPRLTPWVLRQEGWHLEVEDAATAAHTVSAAAAPSAAAETSAGAQLSIKGVVYNEMKGVYSSRSSARAYATHRVLFPDVPTYRQSSGGDPLRIPDLTFEQFKAFHEQHYHPSNARIFFFGDDDPARRLHIVHEYLKDFAKRDGILPPDEQLLMQARLPAPVSYSFPYPAAQTHGADGGVEAELGELDGEEFALAEEAAAAADGLTAEAEATAAAEADALMHAAEQSASPDAESSVHAQAAVAGVAAPMICEAGVTGAPAGVPDEHDVTLNWVCNDAPLDDETRFGLTMLGYLLLGKQTATLTKALTDSALGSGVLGDMDASSYQASFTAGLKGVKDADRQRVLQLVRDTLARVAEEGFTQDHIESSFHTFEFSSREFAGGGGPRGLSLFLNSVGGWMYGRNVISELRFESHFSAFKARVASDPRYFQNLVRKYLLDNTHCVTVHMYPDPEFNAKRAAAERERLAELRARMSAADVEDVRTTAAELLRRQREPDSPEALATIPYLQLSDLPVEPPTRIVGRLHTLTPPPASASGAARAAAQAASGLAAHGSAALPIMSSEQATNGIGYAHLYFNTACVPPHLLPYVPLFSWALTSCGTSAHDEVDFSNLVDRHTGGIGASSTVLNSKHGRDKCLSFVSLSGKALREKSAPLASMLMDSALTGRLDRRDRVTHYLKRAVASAESSFSTSGHSYAASLLAAQSTAAGWLKEMKGGLTSYLFMKTLLSRIETGRDGGWEAIADALEQLRAHLFQRNNLFVSLTGDERTLSQLEPCLADALSALPAGGGLPAGSNPLQEVCVREVLARPDRDAHYWPATPWPSLPLPFMGVHDAASVATPSAWPTKIALVVPTQVNYVVKAGIAVDVPPNSLLSAGYDVTSHMLRTGYMWEKVRVEGGAYGGFNNFDRQTGAFSFVSYRDPNLARTLDIYDGAGAYLSQQVARARTDASAARELQDEFTKAIISSIGEIDAPMPPSQRGDVATLRHILGVTEDEVRARRQQILSAGVSDLSALADAAATVRDRGSIAVVTSEEALAAFHAEHPTQEPFTVIRPLQVQHPLLQRA